MQIILKLKVNITHPHKKSNITQAIKSQSTENLPKEILKNIMQIITQRIGQDWNQPLVGKDNLLGYR